MRPYLAHTENALRLLSRNKTALFFTYMFPLVFFFLFAAVFGGAKNPGAMLQVISTVLTIGVLGSGLMGAGITTVQEREENILRRFKVTPSGARPILFAIQAAGLIAYIPLVVGIIALWPTSGCASRCPRARWKPSSFSRDRAAGLSRNRAPARVGRQFHAGRHGGRADPLHPDAAAQRRDDAAGNLAAVGAEVRRVPAVYVPVQRDAVHAAQRPGFVAQRTGNARAAGHGGGLDVSRAQAVSLGQGRARPAPREMVARCGAWRRSSCWG